MTTPAQVRTLDETRQDRVALAAARFWAIVAELKEKKERNDAV
jgi:hypothetical protein